MGRRAVIVGAEHVSFSAVATLAHGGASVAGLVTELPRHQSLTAFRVGAAVRYRAPVWTRTAVSAIHGAERVESVELTELESGRTRTVDCDLVIFTADWIPDHELAVMAGCELDRGSLGPLVERRCGRPRPGMFAAGNLVHPAETADVCGARRPPCRHRRSPPTCEGPGEWPASRPGDRAAAPLAWVAPNLAAGERSAAPARPVPAALARVRPPRPDSGPPGRTGALERAGQATGARALGAHPGRLGGRGRSRFGAR